MPQHNTNILNIKEVFTDVLQLLPDSEKRNNLLLKLEAAQQLILGPNFDVAQNVVTTVDSTRVNACSYSFPANASALIQTRAIGVDTSQNTYVMEQRYAVKRDTGTCSLVELPTNIINVADVIMLMANSTLNVNGAAIELDVTGLAATTINWVARMDIMYLN